MGPQRSVAPTVAPKVGDRFYVKCSWQRDHDETIAAEILERRLLAPMCKVGVKRDCVDENLAENFQYYVHYFGYDRRLDEWVEAKRVQFGSVVDEAELHGTEVEKVQTAANRQRKSRQRRSSAEASEAADEKDKQLAEMEKKNEAVTKVKNIHNIAFAGFKIATWYYSPFPDEYHGLKVLRVCSYCLKYMRSLETQNVHCAQCLLRGPPGVQIYKEGTLSMFEVVGKEQKLYCQNLCLLSKLFLDHKTLYYDVDPFLFYVLCELDKDEKHQVVGYFSKEKQSQENYNLACILTLPPWQKKGYGKFLISMSYALSKIEGRTGSPEKPLSDLGQISYRSYWSYVLLGRLLEVLSEEGNEDGALTNMERLSSDTGIAHDDVVYTMHQQQLLKIWKGQHVVTLHKKVLEERVKNAKKMRLCDPAFLTWEPKEHT
jgi:histone acetyltransferase MYST1